MLPKTMQSVASRIGVIHDEKSKSICTAFCVGVDTVATAAHCLYSTGDQPAVRLTDVTVKLHGSDTKSRIAGAAQGTAEANVLAGSTSLNVHPPIDATRDWALVRLEKPLCRAGTFRLARRSVGEVMRLAKSDRIYNVAYHRDLPKWGPRLGRPCHVQRNFRGSPWTTIRHDFAEPDELLLHTCDTGGASSGSPLLVDGPDGPEVIGINVGTYVQSKVIMLNDQVVHRFKSDDVANTGVNSLAFAAALDNFRASAMLTTREDVRRLQDALAAKALYTGPHDGRYHPRLHKAIADYERAAHMPVTGLATHALLHTLTVESDVVTGRVPKPRPASRSMAARRHR